MLEIHRFQIIETHPGFTKLGWDCPESTCPTLDNRTPIDDSSTLKGNALLAHLHEKGDKVRCNGCSQSFLIPEAEK